LGLRENKENRVSEETMVLMERKDYKENRVFKGLLDLQVLKDHKGWQEQTVPMV
jgi:hypothetical protein